uniref:Uncharacterized protein n=1 Tax=Rhabditophanes sp. KR3021 TaxID=114890 RepID=A0AC35THG4_9BILA
MGCDCILPPPIFDLPPPPDPSYIFELLSDEPLSSLRKIQLESCEFSPILDVLNVQDKIRNLSPQLLPYLLLCLIFILIIVLIVIIFIIKLKRSKQSSIPTTLKKPTTSFDVCGGAFFGTNGQYNPVLNNSSSSGESNLNWSVPYERSNILINGGLHHNVYGSASHHDIVHHPFPHTAYNTSNRHMRPSNSTTLKFPVNEEGYCTVRHYDDIGGAYATPDISCQTFRKPPPSIPPPPVPLQAFLDDNASSCSSSSAAELERIHGIVTHSPPINTNFGNNYPKYPHGGRESGYGTGPSRLQNHLASPRSSSTSKPYTSPNTSSIVDAGISDANMTYV